jgi:hypothetical protein
MLRAKHLWLSLAGCSALPSPALAFFEPEWSLLSLLYALFYHAIFDSLAFVVSYLPSTFFALCSLQSLLFVTL